MSRCNESVKKPSNRLHSYVAARAVFIRSLLKGFKQFPISVFRSGNRFKRTIVLGNTFTSVPEVGCLQSGREGFCAARGLRVVVKRRGNGSKGSALYGIHFQTGQS